MYVEMIECYVAAAVRKMVAGQRAKAYRNVECFQLKLGTLNRWLTTLANHGMSWMVMFVRLLNEQVMFRA